MDPQPITFIVKEFTDESVAVLMLTVVANAYMTMRCFPSSQKEAIIVLGFKKTGLDPSEMKNYPPFSNLSLRMLSILSYLYI